MAINQSPQEHAFSTMGADLDLCQYEVIKLSPLQN